MDKFLHIVCLDVPWPPDYGGAIDMMNRIKSFRELKVRILLHYFSYNERGNPPQLKNYCEEVFAYNRFTGWKGFRSGQPYIVSSRIHPELIQRLNQDDHPVLLEGVHCTGVLPHIHTQRRIVVRMHNDESVYYKELARSESTIWKKLFFLRESRLLESYQKNLPKHCTYACVNQKDLQKLVENYQLSQSVYIPTFPSWQTVISREGKGSFCLYHGNLSVSENEEAALWLLRKVFNKLKIPLVIAGKNPSRRLHKMAELYSHTCLVANPSEQELDDLIRKAHIHILPALNQNITGIKLKLVHALFEGRHCITTPEMVQGTGLESLCHIARSAEELTDLISDLYMQPFSPQEAEMRKQILEEHFSNLKNTRTFIQYLW
ncbi:MAG: glycosyltransferase [Chitinophagaceae bacterium]|nr:glycosyltransferase [Chitinophagaceae bacterium]